MGPGGGSEHGGAPRLSPTDTTSTLGGLWHPYVHTPGAVSHLLGYKSLTIEYAMGSLAAAALAGVLYMVINGGGVVDAIEGIITDALSNTPS